MPWTFPNVAPTRHFKGVLGSCIELRCVVSDDVILFAADRAGFDFQHKFVLHKALEQLCGNIEVFLQREIAAVEHVAVEKIRTAYCATFFRLLHEWEDKLVELVFQTMVSVQRDVNWITLRDPVHMLSDGDCAKRRILQRSARRERAASRGNLDDAVGFALRESTEDGIRGSE